MHELYKYLRLRLDIINFSSQRANYFAYLYMVLEATAGNITIRDLFNRDLNRYGLNSTRGRLSSVWSQVCEISGGDLYTTWLGCFPVDELLLIRVSQNYGNKRLLAGFKALADHLDLLLNAKRILWSTLGVAILALSIAVTLLFILPWWTVPSLKQSFAGLPQAYLGDWSSSLFAFAYFLQQWVLFLPPLLLIAVITFLYSLPRTHGVVRQYLDRFGLWRLYRQVQALRFLSLVAIILQPDVGTSNQLRPVISMFYEGASPWLRNHIHQIIYKIDQGISDANAFDTGLLDQDLFWFFSDVAEAKGLQPALQMVLNRMRSHWLKDIQTRATTIRWLSLLFGVAVALGMGLWHYAAIDDLRKAWMMFHAV